MSPNRIAKDKSEDRRAAGRAAVAGRVAQGRDAQWRRRQGRGQRGENGRRGGGGPLEPVRKEPDRETAQEFQRGRTGATEPFPAVALVPPAERNRRRAHVGDPEMGKPRAETGDAGESVRARQLMEPDAGRPEAVRQRLSPGEPNEDALDPQPNRRGESGAADPPDRIPRPCWESEAGRRENAQTPGAPPRNPHPLAVNAHLSQPDAAQAPAKLPFRKPEVQHRGQQHVAAGAGGTINEKDHRPRAMSPAR